jgi:hypothetical protein
LRGRFENRDARRDAIAAADIYHNALNRPINEKIMMRLPLHCHESANIIATDLSALGECT